MAAVNPVDSHPVDYYALWDAYKAGYQPEEFPLVQPGVGGGDAPEIEQGAQKKGLDQVFSRDLIESSWNLAMLMMTTVKSTPSKTPMVAPTNPGLCKYVADRRIEAHLQPVYVY